MFQISVIVCRLDAVHVIRFIVVLIVALFVVLLERGSRVVVRRRVVCLVERFDKVQLLRFAVVEESLLPYGLLVELGSGSRRFRCISGRRRCRRRCRIWSLRFREAHIGGI